MNDRGATLATLAQVRREIKEVEDAQTANDFDAIEALRFVTARIQRLSGRAFFPTIATEYIDSIGYHMDDVRNVCNFPKPLLSLTTLTVGDVEWTEDEDFQLQPRTGSPITGIRALSGKTWGALSSNWEESIAVTGAWGYHTNYAGAFYSVGETLSGALTSNASYFVSADANGRDALRQTPRYSAGMLLRIDSELIAVLEADYESNIVYIRRGMFGTTAAAHSIGAAIEVFAPEDVAVRAALRWASYLFKRRGQFNKTSTEIDGVTVVTFPEDAPEEVLRILAEIGDHDGVVV